MPGVRLCLLLSIGVCSAFDGCTHREVEPARSRCRTKNPCQRQSGNPNDFVQQVLQKLLLIPVFMFFPVCPA